MKKETIAGAMAAILILSVFAFLFSVRLVRAEPETISVPTDYAAIQGAVNAAQPGDTVYVHSGTYYENVVVNKTVSLVGEDRSLTIVDGNFSGHVFDITQNSVNITGFTIRNAGGNFGGIVLDNTGNCHITGNDIVNNSALGSVGISLWNTSYSNIINGNEITDNRYGISILGAPANSIFENTIAYSTSYGVNLDHCANNTFYHNNFLNNAHQVFNNSDTDLWDAGYPSGGNYWSNYNGTDAKHGGNQDLQGSDGIGDTPYIIDASNRDHYPLMRPWTTGVTRYPWPMFHNNPTRTGYTESPGSQTNQTRWVYEAGSNVYSSPAVANGKVYFGSIAGQVYCLDALSGGLIWNYKTGTDVYSSPAVVDGKVYVGSEDDKVYCLDALSGASIWNYTTGSDVLSSPAVVDGKVYVGSRDNKIYCLDALSGRLVWNYTTGGLVDSSPAVAYGRVYFGSAPAPSIDGKVYCLDALTGAIIWTHQTFAQVTSSPAVVDGKVYIGSGPINSSLYGEVYCLDGLTGALVWNSPLGPYGYVMDSSPAVANGRVYVGSMDNRIYCLAASTGEHLWNYTTGDNQMHSSPAVVDGRVYFGSGDSNVYCLDALSGAVIWEYRTGSYVFSSPAVADGVVFIGSWDSCVYAIGSVIRVPEDYKTIQGAINAANPGDTIVVGPGVYHESLIVDKTLTILGRMGSEPAFVGSGSGIAVQLLQGASGTVVADVEITNWAQGILIANASNCRIYATTMSQMNNNAIALTGTNAIGNQIYSNIFQNNAIAVNLTASSTGNAFYKNIIISSTIVGLNVQSNGNVIYANTISQNQIGINMTNSNSNIIYHNNFIGNTIQANIMTTATNTWDDGYPSGGNHWSDYTGQDYKSGLYQDQAGNDGIGDTGYPIGVNNVDRYPLTKPFNAHDIGIAGFYMPKTVVGLGCSMNTSLRILNYGVYDETFTVKCYANTAILVMQTIALAKRNSTILTFKWNTFGFAWGNYTLSAYAWPVQGETDTSDNNFTGSTIHVGIPGNVNYFDGSRKVDMIDMWLIQGKYGAIIGDPRYVPNYDIDDNGKIDMIDLWTAQKHFGQIEP